MPTEVAADDSAALPGHELAPPAPPTQLSPAKPPRARFYRSLRGFLRRLIGLVWGYDYFISYHWASGGKYAIRLARVLSDRGFDCFLDRSEYAMGDDWRSEGIWALRHSQRLVVVATREAVMCSEPVLREIEAFASRTKHIIPICFGEIFSATDQQNSPALTILGPSVLALVEEAAELELGPVPTGHVIAGITESHQILRKRALRGRIVLAVITTLLAAAATTSLLWRASENSKAAVLREIGLQLQETGREALLNGDAGRALPFLLGALEHGVDTVALRLMLADATYVPVLAIEAKRDIKHAEFNRAGGAFVTADDQPRAIVWDTTTGRSVFQPETAAAWAAFDPTGRRLVTTDAFPDGRARSGTKGLTFGIQLPKNYLSDRCGSTVPTCSRLSAGTARSSLQ